MIQLRNFTKADAQEYIRNLHGNETQEQISAQIQAWNTKEYEGRYFEMFAVIHDHRIVGTVSVMEVAPHMVSVGPQIFSDFQRRGYGKAAVLGCMKIAKEKGYTLVMQQIRSDNDASIALHRSLGFETDGYLYRNRRDKPVSVYVKIL